MFLVVVLSGKVEYSRNGGPFESMMHIDGEEEFYVFFDIAGQVTKIRLLGTSHFPSLESLVHLLTAKAFLLSIA